MSSDMDNKKAWDILEKVALSSVQEQKRTRRWGIFFKVLTFAYLFIALALFMPGVDSVGDSVNMTKPHTAYIKLHGLIMEGESGDANAFAGALRKAFENEQAKAILISINSPGGSPVHAGYMYDEIVRLKNLYPQKKVYAVIGDMGASAAYYVAAAADEIYADKASLVGSIGVISASFGFDEALKKLGVERRVIAAGENKAFLDPYQPLKDDERVFWEETLAVVHQQFIEQVKKGRGEKLVDSPEVFSGLIWTGEQAKEMGLIDGLGSPGYVAREVVGVEDIVDYTPSLSPLDALVRQFGASAAEALATELKMQSAYPVIQ